MSLTKRHVQSCLYFERDISDYKYICLQIEAANMFYMFFSPLGIAVMCTMSTILFSFNKVARAAIMGEPDRTQMLLWLSLDFSAFDCLLRFC